MSIDIARITRGKATCNKSDEGGEIFGHTACVPPMGTSVHDVGVSLQRSKSHITVKHILKVLEGW